MKRNYPCFCNKGDTMFTENKKEGTNIKREDNGDYEPH